MSDNRFNCPKCAKSIGGSTREGGVRVKLAITLVKSDGTVHGPCSECGEDVIVAVGGAPSEGVQKAMPTAPERSATPGRARLVLDMKDLRG